MANPFKGEVEFEADGKTYKLSYSANALCELEDALGKRLDDILEMWRRPKEVPLRDMRVMFWAALLDHHPDITLDAAKVILSRASLVDMMGCIGGALMRALPAAADGDEVRPPMPDQCGTGPAS